MRIEIIFNTTDRYEIVEERIKPDYQKADTFESMKELDDTIQQAYRDFKGPVFEDAENFSITDGFLWVKLKEDIIYAYPVSKIRRLRIGDRD